MTVAWLTLLLVLGTPLVALADWTQFQGGPTHAGLSDGPSAPLEVTWRLEDIAIDDADVTGGLSAPVVAEDGTIVVVGPNEVLAFDGDDRSEVFSAERDLGRSTAPAIGDGPDGPVVVFVEGSGDAGGSASPTTSASPSPSAPPEGEADVDSHLSAIDLRSGELVWPSPVPLGEVVVTPVTADGSVAFVGDIAGTVTAVDLVTGDVMWTADLGSAIAGAVTVDGDRVLVATVGAARTPGVLVALDRATGDERWRSGEDAVRSYLVSAPVVADGRILVLESGTVVALDAEEGRPLWRTEIVNPLTTPFSPQGISTLAPVSADGEVYVVDATGRAFGIDAATGAVRWDQALNDPSPLTPPVLTDANLLVPTNSGTLYAVDRATGHLAFRIDAGGPFLRGIADAGDVLVAVTGVDDAAIVAFGEDPDGVLTDEPSPTTLDLGALLAGFVLGGVPVAIVALVLARPLQRRLGLAPGPEPGVDPEEGAG